MHRSPVEQSPNQPSGLIATTVPALERGLLLLRLLGQASTPLTLSELSNAIGVSRSTVHSLLATLQHHGMIEKDTRHKTYRLGLATFELGSAYLNQVSLVSAFNEVAPHLVARCRETVKLAVLDGREVVYLGKQEGLYSVRLVARVGSRMPAHATAVGKLLLAQHGDQALEQLYVGYDWPVRSPNTIHSLDGLLTEITTVRACGYALDREESALGLQCVAAPIRDHSGEVIAAASIGVPNDRLVDSRMVELTALALEYAQQISQMLGWGG